MTLPEFTPAARAHLEYKIVGRAARAGLGRAIFVDAAAEERAKPTVKQRPRHLSLVS